MQNIQQICQTVRPTVVSLGYSSTQTLVCVICVWWLDQVLAVSRIYPKNSQENFTCTGAIMHSYDWPSASEVTKNDKDKISFVSEYAAYFLPCIA